MSNLIQMFGGNSRFYSKFNRSMFRDPDTGDICSVDSSNHGYDGQPGNSIACRKLKRLASGRVASSWDRTAYPYNFFKDMSTFATPELGYRTGAAGKVLLYITRNPGTYHRGTSTAILSVESSDLTAWLASENVVDLASEQSDTKLTDMVMNPEFLTMSQGLEAIRAGRIASFAINANVAVTPAEEESQDIWYKTRRVGKINSDGNIECSLKYINLISQETRNG
ncbi:hypothetical protein [Xanthomonas phage DES1]|nr:hypothetical protein [Xanthomonas phage DES1]